MLTEIKGKVTVIILNYNGKKYLKKCIESIQRQTYRNHSVLIVDNGSDDDSVNYLSRQYPQIELIVCDENKGFAAGNNLGIMHAIRQGTEYVLLLNVDTVPEANMIEKLIDKADESTVTVPRIYSDKRMIKIWYAGGELDYVNGKSYHCCEAGANGIKMVGFACGCCVLIHKDIILRNGMFDEKYFLYFEDTDLSFRWTQSGVKIKYIPQAKMWHKIGASGGNNGMWIKSYYMARNRLYFIKKYQSSIQKNVHQVALEIFIDYVLKEHDQGKRKYVWWGILDFYKGKMSKFNH